MANMNQKLALNARLHKALHQNVYILGMHYPMNNDLTAHFKEPMFEKPNSAAFHHLSFYLMSIIEPKYVASSSWAMFEIKMEAKYRREFLNFVDIISKEHPGHISPIVASWIVSPGGIKVAKLMFELSQIAFKVHIQRKTAKKINLNISDVNIEETITKKAELKEILLDKITLWHTSSTGKLKICSIYKEHIPVMESEMKKQKQILVDCVNGMFTKMVTSKTECVDDLINVFNPSAFINNWTLHIDTRTAELEKQWQDSSLKILSVARKCKDRSSELVQLHMSHNKNSTLEYDESKDKFHVPAEFENGLSVSQNAILKSNVQDGVLDFANLLKSYTVIITQCFKSHIPFDTAVTFQNSLEEKENLFTFIMQQSKDLLVETFKFHNQLKDAMDAEQSSVNASLTSTSTVYDVLNIPSLNLESKKEEDHSQYWSQNLEKFKFSEFKHPFKSEKPLLVLEHDTKYTVAQQNSIINKGLELSTRKEQLLNKLSKKPDYMKNIEELKKNMEIISDVGNKTCATQQNVTLMSRIGTERKQTCFSSNRLRYMLTSVKKKSTTASKNLRAKVNDRSFRKTWENLFNESSEDSAVLKKALSSPNLLSEEASEHKKRKSRINRPVSVNLHERISGIKEIDYSSFLSELGSTPNLSSSSQKENIPNNRQHTVVTETVSIVNKIEIETFSNGEFKKPLETPPNQGQNRRKSIDTLIDTYKKFKQNRIGVSGQKKIDESSKVITDSFLETLDIANNKSSDIKLTNKDESSLLSSVPDLLSPSLDFPKKY